MENFDVFSIFFIKNAFFRNFEKVTFTKSPNLGVISKYKCFTGSKTVGNIPFLLKIDELSTLNAYFGQKSAKSVFKDNPTQK